jgi:uncharacterized protein YqiB (DUF1249 family)
VGKSRYKLDLSGLHAQCEANYARLIQLLPDINTIDRHEFDINTSHDNNNSSARICIDVVERCKYTTMLTVYQSSASVNWVPAPKFDVRIYHDAAMAEVIGFRAHRKVLAKYEYPNEAMHHQDEKHQLNCFLGEWLGHCMQLGCSVEEVVLTE